MIVFKEIKDSKLFNTLTYAGYKNETLFGKCRVNLNKDIAHLEVLEIDDNFRGNNLGEGLLRSTLNKLDKIGIKKVYYKCYNPYLIKMGFMKEDNRVYVDLPNFFNSKCRSGEIDNEI